MAGFFNSFVHSNETTSLDVEDGGQIEVKAGGTIIVDDSGTVSVASGGLLSVSTGGMFSMPVTVSTGGATTDLCTTLPNYGFSHLAHDNTIREYYHLAAPTRPGLLKILHSEGAAATTGKTLIYFSSGVTLQTTGSSSGLEWLHISSTQTTLPQSITMVSLSTSLWRAIAWNTTDILSLRSTQGSSS